MKLIGNSNKNAKIHIVSRNGKYIKPNPPKTQKFNNTKMQNDYDYDFVEISSKEMLPNPILNNVAAFLGKLGLGTAAASIVLFSLGYGLESQIRTEKPSIPDEPDSSNVDITKNTRNKNEIVVDGEGTYIVDDGETDSPSAEEKAQAALKIIDSNPSVKSVYLDLKDSVSRFSEQLGEDAIPLIKQRVEEIGGGKVKPIDVLKILDIESDGRIYEEDSPSNILVSFTGEAFGPFQLTPDTVSYLNDYFGLTGTDKELDVMNPYDNLDACIYNLRFLFNKVQSDIKEGKEPITGDDIYDAIAWHYHDGAWANSVSSYGSDYVTSFRKLSLLDEQYPEVAEFILS